jgi:hypothetical protein
MDTVASGALSAQEQAIESGAKTMHAWVTERVLRLF